MRVLVTGASGFLGGSVVPQLVARGHDVTCLVRRPQAAAAIAAAGAATVHANLDERGATARAFLDAAPDTLVNLASLGFGHASTIIDAANGAGVARAVYVSTTGVSTRLDPPSKRVRLDAEAAIQRAGGAWTIVRPTMIYGAAGDRNVERLLRALRRTPVFPLPAGDRLHQPVHVDDLASSIVNTIERERSIGNVYEVAGPEALPFRRIVQEAARGLGRRVRLVPLPTRPLLLGGRLLERAGQGGPVSAEQLARLLEDKAFDIGPARVDLGHDPRPFLDGVAAEARLLGLRP